METISNEVPALPLDGIKRLCHSVGRLPWLFRHFWKHLHQQTEKTSLSIEPKFVGLTNFFCLALLESFTSFPNRLAEVKTRHRPFAEQQRVM